MTLETISDSAIAETNAAKCHHRRRKARYAAARIRTGSVTTDDPRTLNTLPITVIHPVR